MIQLNDNVSLPVSCKPNLHEKVKLNLYKHFHDLVTKNAKMPLDRKITHAYTPFTMQCKPNKEGYPYTC